MLEYLKNENNTSWTENGAESFATTKSYLLDWFSQAGALRNRDDSEVISMFSKALSENQLLAMKSLFYFRDVRGGQGERQTFRTLIRYIAENHSDLIRKNIELIPYFGRWDDVYSLFDTKLEPDVASLIIKQFHNDIISDTPSLLGKWLKSENTSSPTSRQLAKKTRKMLKLSPKEYRKHLSSLRKKINIVESLISSNRWFEIDYSRLPSQAGLKYKSAFYRHDLQRYEEYIEQVMNGEAKINTGTLFPYELVRRVENHPTSNEMSLSAMWDNLPDYIGDNKEDSIAVVDVSGSMSGLPMDVAISVGLYLAERNKGKFHNHFITFSESPKLVEIVGSTFCEKVRNIKRAEWGYNTNVASVFSLLLNTAIKYNISKEEMVRKVYIISDMEFDSADSSADEKLFEHISAVFQQNGYEMPKLVFWNVDARNTQFPMTMNHFGVQLVSGCSPSIFKNLMKGEFLSAYDLMLSVLNDKRYDFVTI